MLDAKIKQIAQFEETYGSDHGQTTVHAIKKFCTNEKIQRACTRFQQIDC